MKSKGQGVRIGIAVVIILGTISYLAISGVQANKSYYVTIQELQGLGDKAYTRHLRVAGNVEPGSIERNGTNATFMLVENDKKVKVSYQGVEPPPDTFKDNSQALAVGTYGRDGVFHATAAAGQMRVEVCSGTGSHCPARSPRPPQRRPDGFRTPAPTAAK